MSRHSCWTFGMAATICRSARKTAEVSDSKTTCMHMTRIYKVLPTLLFESVNIDWESANFCSASRTKITLVFKCSFNMLQGLVFDSVVNFYNWFYFVWLAVEAGGRSLGSCHNILNQILNQNHNFQSLYPLSVHYTPAASNNIYIARSSGFKLLECSIPPTP